MARNHQTCSRSGGLRFQVSQVQDTPKTGVLHTGTSSQRKLIMAGGLQRYDTKQSPACEVSMGTFLDLLRKHPAWTPKKSSRQPAAINFMKKNLDLSGLPGFPWQGRRWLCTLDPTVITWATSILSRRARSLHRNPAQPRLQIYQDSVLDLLSGLELTLMASNQERIFRPCESWEVHQDEW